MKLFISRNANNCFRNFPLALEIRKNLIRRDGCATIQNAALISRLRMLIMHNLLLLLEKFIDINCSVFDDEQAGFSWSLSFDSPCIKALDIS